MKVTPNYLAPRSQKGGRRKSTAMTTATVPAMPTAENQLRPPITQQEN